jgi:hypothetical protein
MIPPYWKWRHQFSLPANKLSVEGEAMMRLTCARAALFITIFSTAGNHHHRVEEAKKTIWTGMFGFSLKLVQQAVECRVCSDRASCICDDCNEAEPN